MYKKLVLAVFAALALSAGARTVVVDGDDRSPLIAASVFDANGTLVALTDTCGAFAAHLPVTVRCMGYEAATLERDADTLSLAPASYGLPEMTFNLANRDVMRLICYVREYAGLAGSNDTTGLFSEYMVDYMLPVKKLKGFKGRGAPRTLAQRRVARIMDPRAGTDSIAVNPDDDELISWLMLASLPVERDGEYECFPDSVLSDGEHIVPGKYGPRVVFRTTPDAISESADGLADRKDHRWSPWFFKIFGITMEFTDLRISRAYMREADGSRKPENLLMATFSMEALGRGKLLRKVFDSKSPVQIRTYMEIYPVDREYLTVTEARECEKDKTASWPMTVSPAAPALDAATARLVEQAREIQRNAR